MGLSHNLLFGSMYFLTLARFIFETEHPIRLGEKTD